VGKEEKEKVKRAESRLKSSLGQPGPTCHLTCSCHKSQALEKRQE
jgi:hypothetical protein